MSCQQPASTEILKATVKPIFFCYCINPRQSNSWLTEDGINKELKKGKIIKVLLMGHIENGACQSSLL